MSLNGSTVCDSACDSAGVCYCTVLQKTRAIPTCVRNDTTRTYERSRIAFLSILFSSTGQFCDTLSLGTNQNAPKGIFCCSLFSSVSHRRAQHIYLVIFLQ